jgi:peptidoglycan/xylan/chitin deacetylase (PgdA/CDA1 family)
MAVGIGRRQSFISSIGRGYPVIRRALTLALSFALMKLAVISAQSGEPAQGLPFEVGIVTNGDGQTAAEKMWLRSAREQGVPANLATPADLLADWHDNRRRFGALVLPDGLIQRMSLPVVDGLDRYVKAGGRLLVVFDAAIFDAEGNYANQSFLSDLVGVDYAIYGRRGENMFRGGPVFASVESAKTLGLPPGLAIEGQKASTLSAFNLRLSGYFGAEATYPSLTTTGHYDGDPLLVGPDGQIVAGIRSVGEGTVIFANLPLGDLKLRGSDAWMLHRFLRLLAIEGDFPLLAMTPRAVGGMVMNIHVDSEAAVEPLKRMIASGFFDSGPFSIHVTAGPDWQTEGDKLGIDVPHNIAIQEILRSLAIRGHEIGSHGGWIHNYWAMKVTDDSADRDEHFLALNAQALEDIIGKPIRAYSSPAGLQPQWVTNWLQQHNFAGYYSTANRDAAPTRGYRNGEFLDRGIWSFPTATLGAATSFEEAAAMGFGERSQVTPFLEALTRFTADQHEVRLFYFHPTGVHLFPHALAAWIAQARALGRRFRWYTMEELAEFLDRREAASWNIASQDMGYRINAETSGSLKDLAWLVPANGYARPRVIEGRASVDCDGTNWIVNATGGTRLVVSLDYERHKLSDVCPKSNLFK